MSSVSLDRENTGGSAVCRVVSVLSCLMPQTSLKAWGILLLSSVVSDFHLPIYVFRETDLYHQRYLNAALINIRLG
jgi:hypothetical protein